MTSHPIGPLLSARPAALALATAWLAAGLCAGSAWAQAPLPAAEREPVQTLEPKTERIVHHDAGSRIEELRVGGQTRSIEVQTNSRLPGYQVQPLDPAQASDGRGTSGKSSWRILRF
jgi:hypothetical protein